jgi:hypothetical protein
LVTHSPNNTGSASGYAVFVEKYRHITALAPKADFRPVVLLSVGLAWFLPTGTKLAHPAKKVG